jgi:hypothetical protein
MGKGGYSRSCSFCPQLKLRPEAVPRALAARAYWDVGGRKGILWLAVLPDFGQGINDAANKSNKDGRNASKSNGCVEENQTAEGYRELV